MEQIKISVEVSVNLSENTQNFIKSLFNGFCIDAPKQAVCAQPKKSAAPAAPAAPANKTIEDVRSMLADKVNEHRGEIKQKLNELGAPSVTKLDPSKYEEMFNFLSSL